MSPHEEGSAASQAGIAIGMPVYNGAETVETAVRSVLAQTHEEFALLISDDGSTDATPEICHRLADEDPRIRFVAQPRHLGMTANFRYDRDQATGDDTHSCWIAQDDAWDPTFLARGVGALEDAPSAIGFFPAMHFDVPSVGVRTTIMAPADLADPDPERRARSIRRSGFHAIYALYRRDGATAGVEPHDVAAPDVAFSFAMALRGPFALTREALITRTVTGYDLVAGPEHHPVARKALGASGHLYDHRSWGLVRTMLADLATAPIAAGAKRRLRTHVLLTWGLGRWRRLTARQDAWRVHAAMDASRPLAALLPGLRLALLEPGALLRRVREDRAA